MKLYAVPVALALAMATLFSPALSPAQVPAEHSTEEPRRHNDFTTHEGLGFRLGILFNTFAPSDEARSFRYFDFGMRFKAGEYYFDLKLPAITIMADMLLWFILEEFFDTYSEPLLETLNGTFTDLPHHFEMGHARLGYRFRLPPPPNFQGWDSLLDAALGVFTTVEFVLFEIRRDIEPETASSLGYDDPLVISVGGFFALGQTYERLQFDVALGLGAAVRGADDNPERRVLLAMLDADFQFELGYGAATYLRPRLTTYFTRQSPMTAMGIGLTAGLNIRF